MRRGQAALEFISTYGWAILVVLVMIGTIAYFGILNPGKLTPARCTISTEFLCKDYMIRTAGANANVSTILQQTIGKTIYLTNATCTYQGSKISATGFTLITGTPAGNTYSPYTLSTTAWSPRQQVEIDCFPQVPPSLTGQKVKITYTVTYRTSMNGLDHTADGDVYANMQQ